MLAGVRVGGLLDLCVDLIEHAAVLKQVLDLVIKELVQRACIELLLRQHKGGIHSSIQTLFALVRLDHPLVVVGLEVPEIGVSGETFGQQVLLSFLLQFGVNESENLGHLLSIWVAKRVRHIVHNISESSRRYLEIVGPKLYCVHLRVFVVKEEHLVDFVNKDALLGG